MNEKILIVEDEVKLARMLEMELKYEGYRPEKALDGHSGFDMASSGEFDLVLLDIMLPEMSGMELLRRLRRSSSVPVILLTARDSVVDKVAGLDAGADDYVTKPFDIEELLARIRVCLRKKPAKAETVITCQDVTLDPDSREVTVKGRKVTLTRREFDLLMYLMKNCDRVLTREDIVSNVWGYEYDGENGSVDVYIRFLRSKIDDKFNIKFIHTVRGVGYVLRK